MYTLRNFIDYEKVESSSSESPIQNIFKLVENENLDVNKRQKFIYSLTEHQVTLKDDLF